MNKREADQSVVYGCGASIIQGFGALIFLFIIVGILSSIGLSSGTAMTIVVTVIIVAAAAFGWMILKSLGYFRTPAQQAAYEKRRCRALEPDGSQCRKERVLNGFCGDHFTGFPEPAPTPPKKASPRKTKPKKGPE